MIVSFLLGMRILLIVIPMPAAVDVLTLPELQHQSLCTLIFNCAQLESKGFPASLGTN